VRFPFSRLRASLCHAHADRDPVRALNPCKAGATLARPKTAWISYPKGTHGSTKKNHVVSEAEPSSFSKIERYNNGIVQEKDNKYLSIHLHRENLSGNSQDA